MSDLLLNDSAASSIQLAKYGPDEMLGVGIGRPRTIDKPSGLQEIHVGIGETRHGKS
jgi:hypothetical protein